MFFLGTLKLQPIIWNWWNQNRWVSTSTRFLEIVTLKIAGRWDQCYLIFHLFCSNLCCATTTSIKVGKIQFDSHRERCHVSKGMAYEKIGFQQAFGPGSHPLGGFAEEDEVVCCSFMCKNGMFSPMYPFSRNHWSGKLSQFRRNSSWRDTHFPRPWLEEEYHMGSHS